MTVRKVIAILDECIYTRLVPPLEPNAPNAVFFANVKIIVHTTFVPVPKTPFIAADYHKKSPTKEEWKYEPHAASVTALSGAPQAFMVAHTICVLFASRVFSISRQSQLKSWATPTTEDS